MSNISMDGESARGSGMFTRKSSGFVRELGVVSAVGISLAAVAVVNTFINFNAGLTDFSKSDMYLPLLAGAVIWIVAMFAYRHLLDAVPRAGGEYVFLSRIVSPAVGSIAGLGVTMVFTYVLAGNAHFAAQFVPFMLTALGAAFHSTAIANEGAHLTGTGANVIIAIVIMVLVAACSIFSPRKVSNIIFGLILLQLTAFVVLILVLAFHTHTDFVNAFNSFSGGSDAFAKVLSVASSHGIAFGTSVVSAIAIIPFMVLNYNGVLYSYYVGGELRRPGRTYLVASTISIGVLVVLWMGVWALMRARVGLDFMQAQANLGASQSALYGNITSLNSSAGGLGYGLVLSHNPITDILFGTAVPFAEIAVNLAFVLVTTRVLFAQAFDRLLPIRLAKVSEKNNSPMFAIGVVLLGAVFFCILTGYVNLGGIVAQESLFFALILLAGAVAAAFLPYRRPELIPMPGLNESQRQMRLKTIGAIGAVTTVLALFTIWEIVRYSSVYGKFSFASVLTLLLVLGSGPVTYAFVSTRRKNNNSLDLSMAMRELPPE